MIFVYQCENKNCTLDNEYAYETPEIYINYKTFNIDHQKIDNPFREERFEFGWKFDIFNFNLLDYNWRNIIYKEKKGFFKKETKNIIGFVENKFSSINAGNVKTIFLLIIYIINVF